jgi:hypothetical protein
MASAYTKKGYRLEFKGQPNAFVFNCYSRVVVWSKPTSFRKGEDGIAVLQIIAPSTMGQIIATLRAWLSAYDDAELLEQAETVAREAVDGLPEIPEPTPSTPPDRQGMN